MVADHAVLIADNLYAQIPELEFVVGIAHVRHSCIYFLRPQVIGADLERL